ncbi:putative F-box protein At4g38870 [Lycium barbarum]|uniref:putative F-box protein At4g38870 n=1 Tax=Lycium barbarum TaxID=112863 RepID=UPI00293F0B9E|nr:putative F-box protein At4g38870 [Lycium barbarum]
MDDHFSRDVLINIFSRLGVKQLCQLKCLSKEWNYTISSPHFKEQHRDQSKKRPTLSLISYSGTDRSFRSRLVHLSSVNSSNYELVHKYENIAEIEWGYIVWRSGLDLLCFYQEGYVGKIYICNPITKKTLTLPVLSDFAGQACLGYVSSTNEYKVVVSFEGTVENYEGFEEFLVFNILTLKLEEEETSVVGSWRDLSLSCSSTHYKGTRHQPIHINEFIYWLAIGKDNTYSSDHILEMNLENEEVKTLCVPNGISCFGFTHLAEINGRLCYVQNKRDGNMLINIWMLKDHESEYWCLEYSLELLHESAIIGYLPRNNESGDILIWSFTRGLFCYETDTKKLRELKSLNKIEYEWCALFYESFFSIGLPGIRI